MCPESFVRPFVHAFCAPVDYAVLPDPLRFGPWPCGLIIHGLGFSSSVRFLCSLVGFFPPSGAFSVCPCCSSIKKVFIY